MKIKNEENLILLLGLFAASSSLYFLVKIYRVYLLRQARIRLRENTLNHLVNEEISAKRTRFEFIKNYNQRMSGLLFYNPKRKIESEEKFHSNEGFLSEQTLSINQFLAESNTPCLLVDGAVSSSSRNIAEYNENTEKMKSALMQKIVDTATDLNEINNKIERVGHVTHRI